MASLLAAAAARAESTPADSLAALDGLPIRAIRLEIGDVFDPVPPGPLRPVYLLANRLHVKSREATVRAHVLLEPGQPFRVRRFEQQVRVLRALEFVQPEAVRASAFADSVDLTIRTRDAWTTQPEINLERGGGRQFGTFGIAERNLLGLGKSLALSYSEEPAGVSRRVAYDDPAVFESRVRFRYSAADGTSGASDLFALWQPFLTEDDPVTWGVTWDRSGSVARLFESGEERSSFDRDVNDFELWLGAGRRDDGTVRRLTASYRVLDRELGPASAATGAPPEFTGPATIERFRTVTLEGRLWRPRFLERHGVDQPTHIEDVDIGPSVSVELGLSPKWMGSVADEGFLEAKVDFGTRSRYGYGTVRSRLTSRFRRRPVETVRRVEGRWVAGAGRRGEVAFGALGVAGSNVPRDFQVVVGGLNGLRAYPVHALAGRELLRFNAEPRLLVARDVGHLLSVSVATFWDAARAFGPGAVSTGWFHDAGVGLRIAPPSGAYGNLLRLDVAWPLSPTRDGQREAVFSFGSTQAF